MARPKGSGNIPSLDKIRANRNKLEKILLDKALAGDIDAIRTCIELLDKDDQKVDGDSSEEDEEDTS